MLYDTTKRIDKKALKPTYKGLELGFHLVMG